MTPLSLPKLIGHRGARASAPENTLAGIREARRQGAAWVEFDVKLTSDGHAVLFHDETLDNTTDGRGPLRERTLAELQWLDAGIRFGPQWRGERVPTLKQALALLDELDMGFNLEIKPCPGREIGTAHVAMADVLAHWPDNRVPPVISCFKTAGIEAAKAAAPDLPRAYLVDRLESNWQTEATRLGCAAVHVSWGKLTRAQAVEVKAAGLQLAVWTVNDPVLGRELLSWGVDALITDTPAAMHAAL